MRIALVADLHGNLPATMAVDRDLKSRKIQTVYCLGDMVGKGPSSAATMDWAFMRCQLILAGNWDIGISQKHYPADGYYWNMLGQERMERLKSLPLEHHFYMSGLHIRLLHGRPVMEELLFVQTERDRLEALFEKDGETFQTVGYSDCHRAFHRTLNKGFLFNTGSVGNNLGVNRACYAILQGRAGKTPAPFDVSLVSVPYDTVAAVRDAENDPNLPYRESYINEIRTGVYSR
jgi:protein phosphatase